MSGKIKRTVPGDPIAQKRHRHTGKGKFVRTYDPSSKDKENFLKAFKSEGPIPKLEGALSMTCLFVFDRPKSHLLKSGKLNSRAPIDKTSKPDVDNLAKLVKDALNGHAYRDDSQVTQLTVVKEYGEARTEVTISELNQNPTLL